MLKAIHKKTGKIISAFKIENDSSWVGTEKDEWIAPRPEIYNWKFLKDQGINEVELSFVKSHIRNINGQKILICAHFRIECEKAILHPEHESEEHKLAKEAIYEKVINNEILIDKKPIRDLFQIEDLDFEYRISKSKKSKIADIIVIFKEEDKRFGKGIVFEIQFSHQNMEITEDRTYDRVIEGYSVVWLHETDFEDNKLINNDVLVVPFSKALKEYQEIIKSEWKEKSRYYGNIFEEKVKGEIEKYTLFSNSTLKKWKEMEENILNGWESLNESYTLHEKSLQEHLNKKVNDFSIEVMNKMDSFITEKLKDEEIIKRIVSIVDYNKISNSLSEDYHNWMHHNLSKVITEETEKMKDRIYSLLTEQIQNEVIPKIEKDFKMNIKGEIFCKCHQCQKDFPIRSMEFKNGWAYCSDCFKPTEVKNEDKVPKRQQNL